MAGKNVLNVTDQNFENEVLKSNVPVLVDFWAEWCGPCKALSPTIDELAAQYDGKVKIAKVNVDENPEAPGRYRVRGIPTLLLFKNGSLVDQLVGAHPKGTIDGLIKKALSS